MNRVAQKSLSHSLEPICPRDGHRMRYEANGVSWKELPNDKHAQSLEAYHCDFEGCSVRYDLVNGYFTVVFTPDMPYFLEEPGVNLLRCPQHGTWLYRHADRRHDGNDGYKWHCGVEGCDYVHQPPLTREQ